MASCDSTGSHVLRCTIGRVGQLLEGVDDLLVSICDFGTLVWLMLELAGVVISRLGLILMSTSGREYEPVKVYIEGMIDLSPSPTFEDVASRLTSYADRLSSYSPGKEVSLHLAFYTNYPGRGRGNSFGKSGRSRGT
ncbi:hypothetical protein ISN44_As10g009320 [Arabidopsis suecica]|uniref:Uncharacterized protein n=1 Tax=Arabidopsis suecica TaxID=45249 RepID=A0A8T1ZXF6_ARASU|nr:hypothetical protein ISN44_As10g009320 [Arabidopsis suecica]